MCICVLINAAFSERLPLQRSAPGALASHRRRSLRTHPIVCCHRRFHLLSFQFVLLSRRQQKLINAFLSSLQPSDLRLTPMGPSGSGVWLPYGVNDVLKVGRYRPSCQFKAHRDGPWAPSLDEMSLFTLVVYLYAVARFFLFRF